MGDMSVLFITPWTYKENGGQTPYIFWHVLRFGLQPGFMAGEYPE
jgi:hypothetical protein